MSQVLAAKSIDELVVIERANWYFSKLSMIYIGNGTSALGLCFSLWLLNQNLSIFLWGTFALGHIVLCRAYTWWPSRCPVETLDSARHWGRYLTFSSFLQGMIWAAIPLLFLQLDSPVLVAALMLVLIANVAAGVALLSSHPFAYMAYAVPVCLSLIWIFAKASSTGFQLLGLMTGIFMVVCCGLSWDTFRTVSSVIRLRVDREGLLQQLNHQVALSEEAVREKSRFMAAASHDLRQPLAALNLLLAQLELRVDAPGRMLMLRSQHALKRLNGLIHALLDTARLDAHSVAINRQEFSLNDLFDSLRAEFEAQAAIKGLRLRIRPTQAWLDSDPVQLQRILANLLSNALKHTRSGTVLVGARWRESGWSIEVRDTGPGIAADQQAVIFREFYQLDNASRDPEKGVGLGLSIVRRLAALLSVDVTLASLPGKGSSFSVLVDRALAKTTQSAVTPAAFSDPVQGTCIWVVEDDLHVAEAMQGLLQSWCCDVVLMRDADALQRQLDTATQPPDVLLTDYRLPGEQTGIDIIRRVRQRFSDDLPAALVTGDTITVDDLRDHFRDSRDGSLADTINTVRLLRKPLSAPQLRLMISSVKRRAG